MQTNPRIRTIVLVSLLLIQFFLAKGLFANQLINASAHDFKKLPSKMIPIKPLATEPWALKLDPGCRFLVRQTTALYKRIQSAEPLIENRYYSVWPDESGILMVDVFIHVNAPSDTSLLKTLDVRCRSFVDNWAVARLPLEALPALAKASCVRYVEISKMNQAEMNRSRVTINADKVHRGTGLPASYQGDGTIVGLIDSGIDFSHPDFYNSSGSRILYLLEYTKNGGQRVWTKNQIDTNPSGVTQRDGNYSFGHGSHTSGIAAGGGRADVNYTGVAPKADIVFVKGIRDAEGSGSFLETDITAGCQFIFDKAQQLGKPAVINLSIGGHLGPHDGTSGYETILSGLSGPGRIIVAAAGNDGNTAVHAGGNAISSKPSLTILGATNPTAVLADIWCDYQVLDAIYVQAWGLNDKNQIVPLVKTDWLSVGKDLNNLEMEANGTTFGYVSIGTQSKNELNGDGHITVLVANNNESNVKISQYLWFIVTKGSHSGRIDLWVVGGEFYSQQVGFTDVKEMPGDLEQTLTIPGTAQNVIAVGSYVTKNSWTDVDGKFQYWYNPDPNGSDNPVVPPLGQCSFFSSRGPTRDGRISPNISAPGELIFSALSSHLDESVGYERKMVIPGEYYQGLQGTSMAAPHVTGLVALMLEADPSLDYARTLQILQETAVQDQYTGSSLNNQFGAGKVDALAAMQQVAGTGSAAHAVIDASSLTIHVQPDKTSSVSFIVRNTGSAILNFSMTTTDPDISNSLGNNLGLIQVCTQPRPNPLMKIVSGLPAQSAPPSTIKSTSSASRIGAAMVASDSLLLDDGDYEPYYFIGWDSKKLGMTWLNEFKSKEYDFELQSLTFYMRTEEAETNKNRVAVYDKSFQRIADGTIEFPLAPDGAWFGAALSQPILIKQNERFFIEIETAAGIEYPGGADKYAKITGKSYYMNQDGELIKMTDYPQFAETAWLIRAFGRCVGANQAPNAVAWVSKTAVGVGENITFSASQSSDPDGQIVQYLWNFGDGATSSQMVTNHAYSQTGAKNYSLKVTDNQGATGTAAGTITVGGSNLAPVSIPIVSPSEAPVGATIDFKGNNSYDPDGSIVAYVWSFGDGASSNSTNTTHAYNSPGRKEYSLMVVDNNGAFSTATGQVTITTSASRLTVSPENGSLSAGNMTQIAASFDAWNMDEGNYQGMIHFTSNGGDMELPVYIVVSRQAAVTTDEQVPLHYDLVQNFPNPFNPETTIGFDLPEAAEVRLQVFDVTGRRIQILENGLMQRGRHQVLWNGVNAAGEPVASGIYFYRLVVQPVKGDKVKVFNNRMLLLK